MPICDDSGIIPGWFPCRPFSGFAKVTLGFKWILRNYVLGHLFLLCCFFVKLSDPAALKLNNNNNKKKSINTRSVTTRLGQLLQAAVIIACLIRQLHDALCLARLI